MKPLSPTAVSRAQRHLNNELGATARQRLEKLPPLMQADGRIVLAEALHELFPEKSGDDALTAFRQFRQTLKEAAQAAGINFELTPDTGTRTPPEQRFCWFEGDDGSTAGLEQLARNATDNAPARSIQDAVPLDTLRYFVSYAHDNQKEVESLLKLLEPHLKATKFCFIPWQDSMLLAGTNWRQDIQDAIRRCDFGLLMLSPEFLASDFIRREELPHFLPDADGEHKYPVPVGLHNVFVPHINLSDIAKRQIFRHKQKSFGELTTNAQKRAFVEALATQIVQVARSKLLVPSPPQPSTPAEKKSPHISKALSRRYESWSDFDSDGFVPCEGEAANLEKLEDGSRPRDESTRADAIDYLLKWLDDPNEPPYCALLGDTGMGKTTTCKALALRLLKEREKAPRWPLPVYIDLRLVGEFAKESPLLLKDILIHALAREWQGGQAEPGVSADEVIRLVQEEGGLVIFDGLDEVLVHLSDRAGQSFTRELFRILPPPKARAKEPGGKRTGRVLLTCRTHFFRTLRDQKTYFTTQDRDGVESTHYRAFLLLPFTEAQIESFLGHALPDQDPQRVMDTLRAVHNLSELAARPYTLSLISRHFEQIERWRMDGRAVTGLMLYRHMVLSWLERDTGKHQLTPDHKQALMEYFAAELTRSGARSWKISDVEQWLMDFLRLHPEVAEHYHGKDRGLLKEDLRTATFLVRVGEDAFRFAHTSLQEFFLAGYLHRALVKGEVAAWNLGGVSVETLDFVGQWLSDEAATRPKALTTLAALRDGASECAASLLAFKYFLQAHAKGLPNIAGNGFRLAGVDLARQHFAGTAAQPLGLAGANFRGAQLNQSVWRHVELTGADFSNAHLTAAEFHDSRLNTARWAGTHLKGTVFRRCAIDGGDFSTAQFHRSQLVACHAEKAEGLPQEWPLALWSGDDETPGADETLTRLQRIDGHSSIVTSCVFSPNGTRLLSGSDDSTLKLWDAASGTCLLTLAGHTDGVTSCAFSPDGTRLLSGNRDNTLKLWDATSGACLLTLTGHTNSVTSCAVSPDGTRLLSGGWDRTLKLWDTASGACLLTLQGHPLRVTSCAFSPDGTRLLSGGWDRTLKLWDAASGACLLTLQGHTHRVTSCAFSPDGTRLLSGSHDTALKLWDTASGTCLLTLTGHTDSVTSCAFSPDGARLLSGSHDHTLKLWDAASGACLLTLQGHTEGVTSCTFSPDGTRLHSGSDDHTLKLWDAASGACLLTLAGQTNPVASCTFSPDGTRLLSSSCDSTLKLWDAASGACLLTFDGHKWPVTSCAFSPDGTRLLSGSYDNTLKLWDAASSACLLTFEGHKGSVTSCAFSPNGTRLLTGSYDSTLKLWDAASGACLLTFGGHKGPVTSCAFSPDGTRLLSASWDNALKLWDAASGARLLTLAGHTEEVTSCAFSPNGTRLLSGSWDKTLKLWDAESGACLITLAGHTYGVTSCTFSPDGAHLLSGSYDDTLKLWDAANGNCLRTLTGPDSVTSCAFSPDGTRLLSASDDGTLRQWDAATGAALAPLIHDFGWGDWCTTNPEQTRLLAASGEVWRYLGWRIEDAAGVADTVPLEYFGPVPGVV